MIPVCRTLVFEVFACLTHRRHLIEGVAFQVWLRFSVRHFQVCYVSSGLSRIRHRLTKTIATVRGGAPASENTSTRRSDKIAAISQIKMLNVSSETVEDLPLEPLDANPQFQDTAFICRMYDRRQTCNSWVRLETTTRQMFSNL